MPFCQSQLMNHSTKWLACHIPTGSINYGSRKTSHKIQCHPFVHFKMTVPKYPRHKGRVVCRYDNTETHGSGEKVPCSIKCSITITRVGTLIVATIYLQLIQNRNMFRSFTVLHCSHQHCVQPVASDVEVVGYL